MESYNAIIIAPSKPRLVATCVECEHILYHLVAHPECFFSDCASTGAGLRIEHIGKTALNVTCDDPTAELM